MSLTERAIKILLTKPLGDREHSYRLNRLCNRLMNQDVRLIDAVVKNS